MPSSKRRRVELLWAKAKHRSTPLEEALTAANAVYRITDADDELRDEFAARAALLALSLTLRQTAGLVGDSASQLRRTLAGFATWISRGVRQLAALDRAEE